MADDKKISELDPLVQAASNDEFAIVDTSVGVTKRITFSSVMASPGPIGSSTPSSAVFTTLQSDTLQSDTLQLSSGVQIDNIDSNVNLGTSNTTVPTQNAVKAYVDANTSQAENVRRVFSDTTAVANDVLLVDSTNGNVTIEMLDSSDGRIAVKKVSNDSNNVIVTTSSTIDGQAQFTIVTQYQSYNFLVDSNEFFVI